MRNQLGLTINRLRTERNMTITQLARELNKSRSLVSKWIAGTQSPRLEDLIYIARYFQVDLNTLVFGRDSWHHYELYLNLSEENKKKANSYIYDLYLKQK